MLAWWNQDFGDQYRMQMQLKLDGELSNVKREKDSFNDSISLKVVNKEQDGFNNSGSQDGFNKSGSLKMISEQDAFNDCESSKDPDQTPRESVRVSSLEEEDQDGQSTENASNQLVVYNPGTTDTSEIVPVPDPIEYQVPSFPSFSAPNPGSRVLPSIGAFTVQCATCFKWRLIPTKEKYEEIRENILAQPFVCETARKWRPDISCNDPADISQDGSRLWAIDKPNISQPPPGWQRLLRIRAEGSTKFADVYYVAPSGKRLRSMVEVSKYLFENSEYLKAGVNKSQFSFQIPKPLQENYVRKRPSTRVTHQRNANNYAMPRPLSIEPAEVNPLSWAVPTEYPELENDRSQLTAPYPRAPPAKKQALRRPSKKMYSNSSCMQSHVQLEERQQNAA